MAFRDGAWSKGRCTTVEQALSGGGSAVWSGASGLADVVIDVTAIITTLVLMVVSLRAAARSERARRSLRLLAGAGAAWLVSEMARAAYEAFARVGAADRGPTDVGYLVALPLTVAGLLAHPSLGERGAGLRAVLDAVIQGSALFVLAWATVVGVSAHGNTAGALTRTLDIAALTGDLVVGGLVVATWARTRPGRRLPLGLFLGAATAIAVADGLLVLAEQRGRTGVDSLHDVVRTVGYLLIVVGVLRTDHRRPVAPDAADRLGWAAARAPYAAVLCALVGMVVERARTGETGGVVSAVSIVGAAILVVRQLVATADNDVLTRRLERTVAVRTAELADSERAYRLLFEANPLPMWVYDEVTYQFLAVNDAALAHYGYTRDDFIGMTIRDIRPPEDMTALDEALHGVHAFDSRHSASRHRKSDGTLINVDVTSHSIVFGGRLARLVLANDVTDRLQAEEALAHQALHDGLTGLPNRGLFLDRLTQALARARRRESAVAALFIDLDRFKLVNDGLGHGAGDELLVAVARRLVDAARAGDTVARFGGDEFVVLAEDLTSNEDAVAVALRLHRALESPFRLRGREVFVTVSTGIAVSIGGEARAEALIRDADVAMYQAKDAGRARYAIFDEKSRREALSSLELEQTLRRALERHELRVYYQPEISLVDGRLVGVEALLRWQHPTLGMVGPSEFVGLAETTGLIVPVGAWVLATACHQARAWRETFGHPVVVSVNLSPRQLSEPGIVECVATTLTETGLEPGSLCLEITETALMEGDRARDAVAALRSLGVLIAVDDFGTGYSSLTYLRRFPVDIVKIDRSFVGGLTTDPECRAIVDSVVHLARAMGLRTVAEGVETGEQAGALAALGCDIGQGYHWSRPLPADRLTVLLGDRTDPVPVVSVRAVPPAP